MRRLPFKLLTLTVSTILSGAAIAGQDDTRVRLKQISDYRQWAKMNPEPVKVDPPVNLAFAGG
jgi:hypothetical protein